MKPDRCYTVFLDVSQVFNKVWHQRLLHKIKKSFLIDFYAIIKSYLLHRTFRVKCEVVTQLKEINSEVSQCSVGLVLYLLYMLVFRWFWTSQL